MSDRPSAGTSCELGDGRCRDLPSQAPIWIGLVLLLVVAAVAATLLHHPPSTHAPRPAPGVDQQQP